MINTGLLVCSQTACPLLEDGTCLDGFADPTECPNVTGTNSSNEPRGSDTPGITDVASDDDSELGGEFDEQTEEIGNRATTYIGGDQALSLDEANSVAAMLPSKVVLVAGDFASGKTTLVVEMWAQFLDGPFFGWNFAGSRTLAAFDRRHQPSRMSSGRSQPTTERTQDDDMRLLHLELGDDAGAHNSLLISDVKGEYFGDLVDGRSVGEAVPLARRADLCVLVIDGSRAGNSASRSESMWRSRLLLGALTEDDGLKIGTRLLIAVSKSDLVPGNVRDAMRAEIATILTVAEERGLSSEIAFVSARPEDASSEPEGLQDLLEWVTRDDVRNTPTVPTTHASEGRFFWRGTQ